MDQKIIRYIDKQKSPQREICLALRKIFFKIYPDINEEMKWGALVYDGGRFYIGVVKYGVNLGFAVNGLTFEELKKFSGKGKTMRHIKIEKIEEINEKQLIQFIKLVKQKVVCTSC